MQISGVKTEDGKVSCKTPEGTVVHININQRSALDCLLDTFRFLKDLKSAPKTKPSRMTGSAGHLGFGVAYVSLGLVSIMLAIILCIVGPDLSIAYNGVHFWVGFPFLVSGILNLIAYKFPNLYWRALAFFSLHVNFGVSIAGMVEAVDDIQRRYRFQFSEEICTQLRDGRENYRRGTMPPRYDSDRRDYDLERCKQSLQKYEMLIYCLTILTLLMMIWGLCLSIISIGSRVKSICCSCKLEKVDEQEEALMTSNPSDDIIIA